MQCLITEPLVISGEIVTRKTVYKYLKYIETFKIYIMYLLSITQLDKSSDKVEVQNVLDDIQDRGGVVRVKRNAKSNVGGEILIKYL